MLDAKTVRMDFQRPVEAVIPGAQGRILSVLVETTAPLNLRTLARLADVSLAQASRVMPGLVELGLVERQEVPPSSLFLLARSNVAAQAIVELARSRDNALEQIGAAAAALRVRPEAVIVFGSFARGEAHSDSDIDIVIVRPDSIDEDDDPWQTSLDEWRTGIIVLTGNPVEIVEVSLTEAKSKLNGRSKLWRSIRREGITVYGLTTSELSEAIHA